MSYEVCPISGGECSQDLRYCSIHGCQSKEITPEIEWKRVADMDKKVVHTKPTPKNPRGQLSIGSFKPKKKFSKNKKP